MLKINRYYLKKIYAWLLPFSCMLCGKLQKDKDLCAACEQDIPLLTKSCQICARPLLDENLICGQCLVPPPFQKIYAAFRYEFPMIQLIKQLKFNHRLINARILAELMIPRIQTWYQNSSMPKVIIPIPLHPKRLRERGFNQVLEVLKPIAKFFNLKIDNSPLRIISTLPQSSLSVDKRRDNLKNAFQIRQPFIHEYVGVIDDVVTTGETISEFCRLLNSHGVKKIDVWCIARPSMGQFARED